MAASAGYWIAGAADYVIAHSVTVTGSIGVIGLAGFSAEAALNHVGIYIDGVATSPLAKHALQPLSPEVDQLQQICIQQSYDRFVAEVARDRKRAPSDIEKNAEGRVYTSATAVQIGLVDRLGGLNEAIEVAFSLASTQVGESLQLYILQVGASSVGASFGAYATYWFQSVMNRLWVSRPSSMPTLHRVFERPHATPLHPYLIE